MFRTGPSPEYNFSYIDKSYNQYNSVDKMSLLRYDLIKQTLGSFSRILDFGYGNGKFLDKCKNEGHSCFGHDISDYPLPENVEFVNDVDQLEFDVITFYDSIEHLPQSDLVSFLKSKKTKAVCISVPHMHEELGPEWFKNWKHRRPNEHFHHFDSAGMCSLLEESGFRVLYLGNDEDQIRTPVDQHTNILTVIAKK